MPSATNGATRSGMVRVEERLASLARVPHLLVACDYDGTLAPIVTNPKEARPLRAAVIALRMLAEQPDTHVAVISGRALSDLSSLLDVPESVHLVGSHGSEFDVGVVESLTDEQERLRHELLKELASIAESAPGFLIETKPASIAFHYRMAGEADAQRALEAIEKGPAAREGTFTKRGKMVIELGVVGLNKGSALEVIRRRVGAQAVTFLGDDVTDEDAFATLRGPDLGIKIGEGESRAKARIEDPHRAAQLLARLAEQRASWLSGGQSVPITDHSILSDQRTVALVTPDARITWLCVPRVDSPSIFAELVGTSGAGYFHVGPADRGEPVRQRYQDRSLVLVTEFASLSVTDYLDCTSGRTRQRAGRSDLVRIVRGSGRVRIEFAPRLDFSRTPTQLEVREGGIEVMDAPDPIVLYSPGVEWSIQRDGPHHTAVAEVELGDEPLVLSMRCGAGTLRPSRLNAVDRERGTNDYWERWTEMLALPKTAREQVLRSALTLKALCYGPTGAILAAGTTSLPETIGGVRNWDYRYCWPRDAAIAATALVKLGSSSEAMHLLDWLLGVVEHAPSPDRVQPLYTVLGTELGAEGEISELSGYAGSRPVRVGNAASRQVQLDVFGPVVELVHELAQADAPLTPQHWRVVEAMVSAVNARWREPDHGIWEVRTRRRHHVHSKVMCWLTLDRAIRTSELIRDGVHYDWPTLRDEIARDVLENAWNEPAQSYTSAYDQPDLDAATLWIGLSGLIPCEDERFRMTVGRIERELKRGAGVYRYQYDDGLPGFEGAFLLCTCWLIQSYLKLGRLDDAVELFDEFCALAGPTGLMSEEYGMHTLRPLGNHPQAYTHAGLIECALAIDAAKRDEGCSAV